MVQAGKAKGLLFAKLLGQSGLQLDVDVQYVLMFLW